MINNKKHEFIVCSRNVRQAHKMTEQDLKNNPNTYWEIALKYNIENTLVKFHQNLKLTKDDVVILQGEIIGEGIQGNPYKLTGREFRGYNLIISNLKEGTYIRYASDDARNKMAEYNIPWVPILGYTTLPETMKEMKDLAEGDSKINPKVKREGIVYRSADRQESFKNVSNSYLLKHNG